jgi:DNA-binding NarL/FixJ family response regulator
MSGTFLIADDHALFRAGLRLLLEDHFQPAAVLEFSSYASLREALPAHADACLLLLDLRMPGMDGARALRRLRAEHPGLRLVVISASEERQDILDVLASGAFGFIPKTLSPEETVAALRQVLAGGVYAPSLLAAPQPPERPTLELKRDIEEELTPRQRDVIRLLGHGQSNKEIARALDISEATVKIHLAAIFRLLGVRNRTEAVLKASQLWR